jgi:hypothetical protein
MTPGSSQPSPRRSAHPAPQAPVRDTKSSLYEAALAAVKDREEAARTQQRGFVPPRGRRRRLTILLVIAAAGAALLVARPDWLAGPDAPPPEPPGLAAASLRLTLLRERRRVTDFSRTRGRLPATLLEAGSGQDDLGYEASGDLFRLWGTAGDSLISLRSTEPFGAFLGTSLRQIRNRNAGNGSGGSRP